MKYKLIVFTSIHIEKKCLFTHLQSTNSCTRVQITHIVLGLAIDTFRLLKCKVGGAGFSSVIYNSNLSNLSIK